jgi:hypothetical protein
MALITLWSGLFPITSYGRHRQTFSHTFVDLYHSIGTKSRPTEVLRGPCMLSPTVGVWITAVLGPVVTFCQRATTQMK